MDGLVPRLLEEVVDGRLTVGRETDVDGRLVDGLVPRLLEEVVDGLGRLVDGLVPRLLEEVVAGLGRLVDGLVPRLLEEVVAGGRLTVIFPAGLLTFECLRDGAGLWDGAGFPW